MSNDTAVVRFAADACAPGAHPHTSGVRITFPEETCRPSVVGSNLNSITRSARAAGRRAFDAGAHYAPIVVGVAFLACVGLAGGAIKERDEALVSANQTRLALNAAASLLATVKAEKESLATELALLRQRTPEVVETIGTDGNLVSRPVVRSQRPGNSLDPNDPALAVAVRDE